MDKSIAVNESSIVDLKAELFRKEEKFKQKKSSSLINESLLKPVKGSKTLEKLANLTGKKRPTSKNNPTETAKTPPITSQDNEDFKRAKLSLQSKAEIYEKMRKGELEDMDDENGESLYLVDFLKKSNEERTKSVEDESTEEEWVEFEDGLGRHRKCLKRHLEKFKAADPLFRPLEKDAASSSFEKENARREFMKNKWFEEQEEMNRNPEKDVHYQNIRFDEVREHGVGYYQFSKEETERKQQMESLNKLREQTIEQRAKREKLKEKRQALLEARLAKVRERKLKKQSLTQQDVEANTNMVPSLGSDISNPINETVSDGKNPGSDEVPIGRVEPPESVAESTSIDARIPDPSHSVSARVVQKPTSVQPVIKKTSFGHWVDAQRDERNPDFAPPSIYDQPPSQRKGSRGNWKQW